MWYGVVGCFHASPTLTLRSFPFTSETFAAAGISHAAPWRPDTLLSPYYQWGDTCPTIVEAIRTARTRMVYVLGYAENRLTRPKTLSPPVYHAHRLSRSWVFLLAATSTNAEISLGKTSPPTPGVMPRPGRRPENTCIIITHFLSMILFLGFNTN